MDTKIDLSYLREVTGDDNDIIQEMLELFINDTPQALKGLQEKYEASDWDSVRAEAHKIKPSFMFVGLQNCHNKLTSIENNAREKTNLEQIQEELNAVSDEFNDVKDEISGVIKELNS